MNKLVILIFVTTLSTNSCTSKVEVRGQENPNLKKLGADKQLLPHIDRITMEQGKIKIQGKNLDKIKNVVLLGKDLNTKLTVDKKSNTEQLFVDAASTIFLGLNKIFSLIITDAYGAEKTYPIMFQIANGSVTANMLSNMGAADGDSLVFNSTTGKWEPKPISGLKYKGVWNANGNVPPSLDADSGDYWVVAKNGSFDLSGINQWSIGDWAIFNGQEWQKVQNSNEITSFNGRKGIVVPKDGDYNWNQIDKTVSSLQDIADVADTSPASGQVLKWNGSHWEASNDNVGAAGAINAGAITNTEISNTAAIQMSKIDGLAAALSAKLDSTTLSNYETSTQLNTRDTANRLRSNHTGEQPISTITNLQTILDNKLEANDLSAYETTTQLNTRDTNNRSRSNHTGEQPISSITNLQSTLDSKLDSDNTTAAFSVLQLKDTGSNRIEIKSPNTLSGNLNFILPNNAGSNGYVLKTDGNGTLRWESPITSGSVDSNAIIDQSITNTDISTTANIDQSKIANLTTDIAAKQTSHANLSNLSNATLANNNFIAVDGSGNLVSKTASTVKNDLSLNNVDNLKQLPYSYLDTNISLGTSDVLVPSQNAVKTYADSKISGLGSATDNALVRFDGTTGKTVQQSNVTLDDNGNFNLPNTVNGSLSGMILKNNNLFIHNYTPGTSNGYATLGRNLFVGENAGNTTLGANATSIYSGSHNTAMGFEAGKSITSGYYNTLVGTYAGTAITTSTDNTIIGQSAGKKLTTGVINTLVGSGAGSEITTGYFNTVLSSGGLNISTGAANTIIGTYSGGFTTGNNNITMGVYAASGLNGHYNSILGTNAIVNATSGNQNVIIGGQAGQYIANNNLTSSLNNSIAIGYLTKFKNDNPNNEIIIGDQTTGNGSNTVTIGNGSITDNFFNGSIKLKDNDGSANYVSIKAPNTLVSDLTMIFPNNVGTSGQVLKTDGAGNLSWGDLSISSSSIADASIVNDDISATANIDQSKIFNLTTDLAAKQASHANLSNLSNATLTNNNFIAIDGSGNIVSKSVSTVKTDLNLSNVDNVQQMPLSYLNTTTTLGTSDVLVPSQNAVKTYVDNLNANKQTSHANLSNLSNATLTNNNFVAVNGNGDLVSKSVSTVKSDLALNNVDNVQQMPLTYLNTNTSLGTSNTLVPSQNAVKTYVDNQNKTPGTIAEKLTGLCDGRTVAVASGSYTLGNVTAPQTGTITYADVSGSTIAYTPPSGTKVVEYEFTFSLHHVDLDGIANFKFFIDDTEVTVYRTSERQYSGDRMVTFKAVIAINGTSNIGSAMLDSWSSAKTLKMQFRSYTSAYQIELHETLYWDGAAANVLRKPTLTITAIY